MRKNLLLTILATIFIFVCNGQQFPVSNQYILNSCDLSPALAGKEKNIEGYIGYRDQFVGITGAPLSQFLSVNLPFFNKSGIEFSVVNERADIIKNFYANIAYAYHIKLTKIQNMGFAISGGIHENRLNLNYINVENMADASIMARDIDHKVDLMAGFGFYYQIKNFQFTFYSPSLFESSKIYNDGKDNIDYTLTHQYNASLSYVIKPNKNYDITPIIVLRKENEVPVSYEANAMFRYMNKYWIGATYRKGNIYGASAGMQLTKLFSFNYTYEIPAGGIMNYTSGSHELCLKIKIDRSKELGTKKAREKLMIKIDSLAKKQERYENEIATYKEKLKNDSLALKKSYENEIALINERLKNDSISKIKNRDSLNIQKQQKTELLNELEKQKIIIAQLSSDTSGNKLKSQKNKEQIKQYTQNMTLKSHEDSVLANKNDYLIDTSSKFNKKVISKTGETTSKQTEKTELAKSEASTKDIENKVDLSKFTTKKSEPKQGLSKDILEMDFNTYKELSTKLKDIDQQLEWLKANDVSFIYNRSKNIKNFKGIKREYFIVAGSFKESDNAKDFVEILKGKGINSEIEFNPETKWYHVYAYKYPDIFTAIKKLYEVREDERYNKQVWLYINY
ncbi:MAG: PorP/SprF family type IX secretion system membrane protein [Bacteroidota bacterium]|nr:PorP/SprF family type IX secretion system membrane protein [Bacteroidota bacterium]